MDMALASFDTRSGSLADTVLDYPALVTLLGAHQRSQPTARVARAIEAADDTRPAMGALIALLTATHPAANAVSGSALTGRFNPAVPLSDSASTIGKLW